MSNKREFEPIARAFMAGGPTQLADRVLERSLAEVHHTPQRRALWWAPWRTPVMNIYAKLAAAAVVVVAVGALGVWFLSPGSSAPVGGPAPVSASPSASLEPSQTPEPSATPTPLPTVPPLSGTFTSTRHGISLATPAGWTTRQATQAWDGEPFSNAEDPSVDLIQSPPLPEGSLWLMLASRPLDAADADQWAADQFEAWGCSSTEPVTVDGATGLVGADFQSSDCAVVFVTTGGRGYHIRLYDSSGLPWYDRAWFDEVLATVDLRPEDAID